MGITAVLQRSLLGTISTSTDRPFFLTITKPLRTTLLFATKTAITSSTKHHTSFITAHLLPPHGFPQAFLQSSPTWTSSLLSNSAIFLLGSPLLLSGLTLPGIACAFLLGTLTWRAFGPLAFLLVAFYFLAGTAVTKIRFKQKEREGIAEKRSGKRGPSSVWGSGAAGAACAIAAITGVGGSASFKLWQLGFVASFATKLSDTVSSEIGKAFGKTTYLVTTFKLVPRGTEGAVSLEGTLAGLSASILLSVLAYGIHQITAQGAVVCVVASQIANLFESYAGATLQDRQGFKWINNDLVNVLNISLGAALAMIFFHVMN